MLYGMKAGRIVMIVLGAFLALIGFALTAGGIAGLGRLRDRTHGRVLPDRRGAAHLAHLRDHVG